MKTSRTLMALTLINLALLLFTLAQQLRPLLAQGERPSAARSRSRDHRCARPRPGEHQCAALQQVAERRGSSRNRSAASHHRTRASIGQDRGLRAHLRPELRGPNGHQRHVRDSPVHRDHQLLEVAERGWSRASSFPLAGVRTPMLLNPPFPRASGDKLTFASASRGSRASTSRWRRRRRGGRSR